MNFMGAITNRIIFPKLYLVYVHSILFVQLMVYKLLPITFLLKSPGSPTLSLVTIPTTLLARVNINLYMPWFIFQLQRKYNKALNIKYDKKWYLM